MVRTAAHNTARISAVISVLRIVTYLYLWRIAAKGVVPVAPWC